MILLKLFFANLNFFALFRLLFCFIFHLLLILPFIRTVSNYLHSNIINDRYHHYPNKVLLHSGYKVFHQVDPLYHHYHQVKLNNLQYYFGVILKILCFFNKHDLCRFFRYNFQLYHAYDFYKNNYTVILVNKYYDNVYFRIDYNYNWLFL